eukprot:scaffold31184_cov69-Phaeocystis_antarctica.AAC.3
MSGVHPVERPSSRGEPEVKLIAAIHSSREASAGTDVPVPAKVLALTTWMKRYVSRSPCASACAFLFCSIASTTGPSADRSASAEKSAVPTGDVNHCCPKSPDGPCDVIEVALSASKTCLTAGESALASISSLHHPRRIHCRQSRHCPDSSFFHGPATTTKSAASCTYEKMLSMASPCATASF